jgi:hypothetical protein
MKLGIYDIWCLCYDTCINLIGIFKILSHQYMFLYLRTFNIARQRLGINFTTAKEKVKTKAISLTGLGGL